jgi:hypothetical protein
MNIYFDVTFCNLYNIPIAACACFSPFSAARNNQVNERTGSHGTKK